MNTIVTFRLCKLSDDELLKKVNDGIDNLYIEGKIPARYIPARPDDDFDLLVGELIMRFKERNTVLTTSQPADNGYSKEHLNQAYGAGISEGMSQAIGFEWGDRRKGVEFEKWFETEFTP